MHHGFASSRCGSKRIDRRAAGLSDPGPERHEMLKEKVAVSTGALRALTGVGTRGSLPEDVLIERLLPIAWTRKIGETARLESQVADLPGRGARCGRRKPAENWTGAPAAGSVLQWPRVLPNPRRRPGPPP